MKYPSYCGRTSLTSIYIYIKNAPISKVDKNSRKMRCSCVWFHLLYLFNIVILTLHMSVLEPIAKPSHTEASVLCKLFRYLRTSFMKSVQVFLA